MGKITLTCAIVGVGTTFDVEVDDGEKVGTLRAPAKQENSNALKDVDTPSLQLFLAKTMDGEWLSVTAAMAVALHTVIPVELDEHGRCQGFKWLNPTLRLNDSSYFGENFQPGDDQVHVLVVVPERKTTAVLKRSTGEKKRGIEEVISGFDTLAITQFALQLSAAELAVGSLLSGLQKTSWGRISPTVYTSDKNTGTSVR